MKTLFIVICFCLVDPSNNPVVDFARSPSASGILANPTTAGQRFTSGIDDDSSDVAIHITVDRKTVQVVEPIRVEVVVTAPAGTTVILPEFADQLGKFQVHDVQTKPDIPTSKGNQRTWTSTIMLDTLQTGELEIPSVSVQYRKADSNEFQTVSSGPFPIRVVSLLEDRMEPTDFRDIKAAVDIKAPELISSSWAWWATGGTMVVVSLATGLFVFSRRKPQLSATQWALAEIGQLSETLERGQVEPESVFAELSSVIDEFNDIEYGEDQRPLLPEFLAIANDVKFSNLQVTSDQVRDAILESRSYVGSVSKEAG